MKLFHSEPLIIGSICFRDDDLWIIYLPDLRSRTTHREKQNSNYFCSTVFVLRRVWIYLSRSWTHQLLTIMFAVAAAPKRPQHFLSLCSCPDVEAAKWMKFKSGMAAHLRPASRTPAAVHLLSSMSRDMLRCVVTLVVNMTAPLFYACSKTARCVGYFNFTLFFQLRHKGNTKEVKRTQIEPC